MKIIKICIIFFITILFSQNIFANYKKEYANYKKENITIISYCENWDKKMLKKLYQELMQNFHNDEISYLKKIYIYPDSPYGVNGQYHDDVSIEDGKYKIGKNAYIELFNGKRYDTVKEMAHTLSHEYGHHFMTYYLLKKEGVYGDLTKARYTKIRKLNILDDIPSFNEEYLYHWDIEEIMADDYVQLLGSKTAKDTYDYKSVDELLKNEEFPRIHTYTFNVRPQLNPYIPLATEINGLYEYFFEMAGYGANMPKSPKKPKIKNIKAGVSLKNDLTYTLNLDIPKSQEIYEYTAVMYPKSNPFVAYPLKTFLSNEASDVIFGTYSMEDNEGNIKTIFQKLEGEYAIKIYIKTKAGFLYETTPIYYNFGEREYTNS